MGRHVPRCSWARGSSRWVMALVWTALFCGNVQAEQWQEPARQTPALVLVVDYVGVEDAELPPALRELLGRVDVRVVSRFEPVPGQVLAYARIEVRAAEVDVVLQDATTRASRAKRSVPRGDSRALLRETVAHVLLGLVEPLAEAARLAPPPAPLPSEAAPDTPARPRSPSALGAGLGLWGGPMMLDQDSWGARFVASAALAWSKRFYPQLGFEVGSTVPVSVGERGVRASVLLSGARLRTRITPFEGAHAALDTSVSGGADVIVVKPQTGPAGVALSPTILSWQPAFGVAVTGRVRLSSHLSLVFGAGTDVYPSPDVFRVRVSGRTSEFLETTWLRPYAMLGIDWTSRASWRASSEEAAP